MSMQLYYGTRVTVLPHDVLAHADKATKKDIKVLLALASEPAASKSSLCAAAHVSETELEAALAFWRGTGLLADGEETAPAEERAAPLTPRVVADKGLPSYSTEELSAVLERRGELAQLVNDAQQTFGKVFNTAEIGIIAGLADYLGLDEEYILLLLTHCRNMEKKSLRYVEKMAISLHDEGIHDAAALETKLHNVELMASACGKVRAMFGIQSRALTSKEKAMIENWICRMQIGEDMIRHAYETTIHAIDKPSIPYANSVLERWHTAGYRTVEEVESAVAEYRRKKAGGSSFDVDEFFEAALKRTYGE